MAKETEIEIFGKMTNPSGLSEAFKVEHIMQAEIKDTSFGKVRVRRSTYQDGKVEFVLTVKDSVRHTDVAKEANETSCSITEDVFEAFFKVAKKRYKKTRYYFESNPIFMQISSEDEHATEIPNLVYEVDVFTNENGITSDWVKVDIEVDKLMKFLDINFKEDVKKFNLKLKLSSMPIKIINGIEKAGATPEENQLIDHIFKHDFEY